MKFEFTAGEILQSLTFIVAAIAVYTRIGERLTRVETKLDILYEQYIGEREPMHGKKLRAN